MQKQFFNLSITATETRIDVSGEFKISPFLLTKTLANILNTHPELISVFLDATGAALIGQGAEPTDAEKLNILSVDNLDYSFVDQEQ